MEVTMQEHNGSKTQRKSGYFCVFSQYGDIIKEQVMSLKQDQESNPDKKTEPNQTVR